MTLSSTTCQNIGHSPQSDEQWVDVVGFEGFYRVSSYGRVWAYPRAVERQMNGKTFVSRRKAALLKIHPIKNGYLQVGLTTRDRKHVKVFVHRLVAEAFLTKDCSDQNVVMHLDDNPKNNHYTNLKWGTSVDNMQDCASKGRNKYITRPGESNGRAILTEGDVRSIRNLVNAGVRQSVLADKYGVTRGLINAIVHNRIWKHI